MNLTPRLDRTAFKAGKKSEEEYDIEYWLSKTLWERLCASYYLTCCAYNLPYSADHKLDRTVFSIGKQCHE